MADYIADKMPIQENNTIFCALLTKYLIVMCSFIVFYILRNYLKM